MSPFVGRYFWLRLVATCRLYDGVEGRTAALRFKRPVSNRTVDLAERALRRWMNRPHAV